MINLRKSSPYLPAETGTKTPGKPGLQMNRLVSFLIMVPFLAACTSADKGKAGLMSDITRCEEPRPQVCTMDYRPVCASRRDGTTKTYSNGCGACSDIEVVSWVENACTE